MIQIYEYYLEIKEEIYVLFKHDYNWVYFIIPNAKPINQWWNMTNIQIIEKQDDIIKKMYEKIISFNKNVIMRYNPQNHLVIGIQVE